MTKWKKAAKWIANVVSLLLLLLILCAALALFAAKMQNRPVFIFGRSAAWILTESMEPQIPAGSYILIEQVDAQDVNVGDVIMFYSDDPALHGALNTHRVTAVIGDHEMFTTKGDNNFGNDTVPARGEKVVGRYLRNMPLLTLIGRLFRSVWGLVILFSLTIASVAVTFAGRRKEPEKQPPVSDFDARVAAEVERLIAENAAKTEKEKQTNDADDVQNDK